MAELITSNSDFPAAPEGLTGWPWTQSAEQNQTISGQQYPKITIVTPSFNQGQYLEETIRSVLLQGYPNLEYLIIDGGSTDNSVDVIRKYEKYISFWISEKDRGQSDAINKGIARSTGEIFNWINSDDYLAKGALLKIAKEFSPSRVEVVCGRAENFKGDYKYITPPSSFFGLTDDALVKPNVNQPATFFRMDVVRKLGPLQTELHFCMDLEWWLKYLFRKGTRGIALTDDILVHFREHENSKTTSQSRKVTEDRLKLFSAVLHCKDSSFVPLGDYRFTEDLSEWSIDKLHQLFNSYFFNEVVLCYGKREMNRVRSLLPYVKEKLLTEKEQKEYSRMRFRSTYFPEFVFRIRNKFKH